ncbi:unnamed protein product [Anisakis simplex]|uniref:Ovule protein n=1 Tax=Anisakis simplex TaxID=6269 RepID=A0A0M3J687_ANISI|nr:unnamed protein product [Anisakis simplex]
MWTVDGFWAVECEISMGFGLSNAKYRWVLSCRMWNLLEVEVEAAEFDEVDELRSELAGVVGWLVSMRDYPMEGTIYKGWVGVGAV